MDGSNGWFNPLWEYPHCMDKIQDPPHHRFYQHVVSELVYPTKWDDWDNSPQNGELGMVPTCASHTNCGSHIKWVAHQTIFETSNKMYPLKTALHWLHPPFCWWHPNFYWLNWITVNLNCCCFIMVSYGSIPNVDWLNMSEIPMFLAQR
jgi:hypothetical protein